MQVLKAAQAPAAAQTSIALCAPAAELTRAAAQALEAFAFAPTDVLIATAAPGPAAVQFLAGLRPAAAV